MAADESRVVDRRGDATLHAANVGDEAGRLGEGPLDAVGDCEHRCGHERDGRLGVDSRGVDRMHCVSALDVARVEIVAGDVPSPLAQGERDRPADQPEASDVGATGGAHGRSA
jgi:hypothetical protein